MEKKYIVPKIISNQCTQSEYDHWLYRKANSHHRRDRNRGNIISTLENYRDAIHNAVSSHGDKDYYTGEKLNWSLISTYNNNDSKAGRKSYKKTFDFLPTVDHINDGHDHPKFAICGWRTNDCKNDLNFEELISFCELILKHNKITV